MRLTLAGCTATPFGGYLKALGILRLVSEQADKQARGWWVGEVFAIESSLNEEDLSAFFIDRYAPTPILAPWNGGSGFYPNDNKVGIDAVAGSAHVRFTEYRDSIAICREFAEVKSGKSKDEDERRTTILRRCRNLLNDRAVEWLDAAVGIAADGSRSFAPVLGTGGNEGRLDYTNNFMARIAGLLISPEPATPVRELLGNALFDHPTTGLQAGAAGQYDPGRAGGANQGPGISNDSTTNPWDLILTMEGAVAWASGLYRRQGAHYRAVLCSPFTVRATRVGYGSASAKDDARAEIWTPLWRGPVRYEELKTLLREGRASVGGRPAANGIEFAEAARSLGVDRGIERFVRYSLLKRRGDSYVALPVGTFATKYRSEADRIRQFQTFLEALSWRELPRGAEELRRGVDAAIYQVLLRGGKERMRELMAALGRMLRRIVTTSDSRLPSRGLKAADWLDACGFEVTEVRIAAAIASIFARDVGSIADNLSRADKRFAWGGADLAGRMVSVLERRLQLASALESDSNPLGGACALNPGDATSFIEGSVDDARIEDLLFAFAVLDWQGFKNPAIAEMNREVLPVYAVLKHLFLAGEIRRGPEPKRLRSDPRILSLLKAGNIEEAAQMAVNRLRVAGFGPLDVRYMGGMGAGRLAASLLIPVWPGRSLGAGIFHEEEMDNL
jgi:CRISPR-associated protein Csx17